MRDINHTMQFGAATMFAMILGSYLYTSSANTDEPQYISTVNADIYLDEHSEIGGANTVNGNIHIERNVDVRHSLSTVNGNILTSPGTVVDDQIKTVNGNIELNGTHIGKNVQTKNGDISLSNGSVVEGDIIISSRYFWFDRFFGTYLKPTNLSIDANSSVIGDIHLYRAVNLKIAEGAKLGTIIKHY